MSCWSGLSALPERWQHDWRRIPPQNRWRRAAAGAGDPEPSGEAEKRDEPEIEQALHMDTAIPPTADGFLEKVSSRAYDMRSRLERSMEANSYDVLDSNPWRESAKPVYVLAQKEDKLYTMRTRRARSEVERELDMLFPGKRGSSRGRNGLPQRARSFAPPPSGASRFRMHVEDVREGVLMFEDPEEAAQYCSVLEGKGQQCVGVAELDADHVFAMCQKSNALAVLFRKGNTPPQPEMLQMNLKAKKHSLED